MQPFLAPEHLAQVADAASAPANDPEAELAWLNGYAVLGQALESVAARSSFGTAVSASRDLFEQSLLRDPGMADSWLALSVLEQVGEMGSSGRHTSILHALALCSERLGEQQERFGLQLAIFYVPLLTTRVPLATPTDARLLYVGHLSSRCEHLIAESWLSGCNHELVQAVATHANLRLNQGAFADASDLFELLVEDEAFRSEGQLGGAIALAGMGLWEVACEQAREALEEALTQSLRLDARYVLAGILSHTDSHLERWELEQIYSESPGFRDVAARLGRSETTPASFAQLVALFNSGIVADDPQIRDNN